MAQQNPFSKTQIKPEILQKKTWTNHQCGNRWEYRPAPRMLGCSCFEKKITCEICCIHMWDMTHSHVRHDSCIRETWLFIFFSLCYECWGVAVLRGQITCEIWLVHMWDMTHSYVRHDSFICETWLVHMCDTTHSNSRQDLSIRETWLIYVYLPAPWMLGCSCCKAKSPVSDQSHPYVRQVSSICETCFIRMWDMIHSYVRHDLLIFDTRLIYAHLPTPQMVGYSGIALSEVTHMYASCQAMYESCHTHVRSVMTHVPVPQTLGWSCLVGWSW